MFKVKSVKRESDKNFVAVNCYISGHQIAKCTADGSLKSFEVYPSKQGGLLLAFETEENENYICEVEPMTKRKFASFADIVEEYSNAVD